MIRINQEFLDFINKCSTQSGFKDLIIEQQYKPKELIIKQESKVLDVFIVREGIAKCYLTEDTGKDFVQEFFGEGQIFGEVEMFNDEFSFCSIEALTPLSVLKISRENFIYLLSQNREFNWFILKLLASKIKYKGIRHSFNQSHSTETNLQRLESQFPGLHGVIPKKDIANYLGITERNLNRAIKTLKENS